MITDISNANTSIVQDANNDHHHQKEDEQESEQPQEPASESEQESDVRFKTNIFITFENIIDDGAMFHEIAPQGDSETITEEEKIEFVTYMKRSISHYGSNPYLAKYRKDILGCLCLLENKMPIHNPFLQIRGFRDVSTYMHIYWNHLEDGLDYIGFANSNMIHQQRFNDAFFDQYIPIPKQDSNETSESPSTSASPSSLPMFLLYRDPQHTTLSDSSTMNPEHFRFFLDSYNKTFHTNHQVNDILFGWYPRTHSFAQLYPIAIFQKLCQWFSSSLLEDIYQKLPQTCWGINAEYTEQAMSLFHAIQMMEGVPYFPLPMKEIPEYHTLLTNDIPNLLEPYDFNIRAKYIDNISASILVAVELDASASEPIHSVCKCIDMNPSTKTMSMVECAYDSQHQKHSVVSSTMTNAEPIVTAETYDPHYIRIVPSTDSTPFAILFVDRNDNEYYLTQMKSIETVVHVNDDTNDTNDDKDKHSIPKRLSFTPSDAHSPIVDTKLVPLLHAKHDTDINDIYLVEKYRVWKIIKSTDTANDNANDKDGYSCIVHSHLHIKESLLPQLKDIGFMSNFVPFYKNHIYMTMGRNEHTQSIVAIFIDIDQWEIVHVSNPIPFSLHYETKNGPTEKIKNTMILSPNHYEMSITSMSKLSSNKFLITMHLQGNNEVYDVIYELLIDSQHLYKAMSV